jgi:hypothetical protein
MDVFEFQSLPISVEVAVFGAGAEDCLARNHRPHDRLSRRLAGSRSSSYSRSPRPPAALDRNFGFERDFLRRSSARLASAFVCRVAALGFLCRPRLSRRRVVEFVAPRAERLLRCASPFLPLPAFDPAVLKECNFKRFALTLLDQLQRPQVALHCKRLQSLPPLKLPSFALLPFRQLVLLHEKQFQPGCVPVLLNFFCDEFDAGDATKKRREARRSFGGTVGSDAPSFRDCCRMSPSARPRISLFELVPGMASF